jgi:hypothetical protein
MQKCANDFSQQEEEMFTKTTLGLAVILATASGALAATKTHHIAPGGVHAVYNGTVGERSQIRLDDCVHVAFPQCDGDAAQTQVHRP